ncbi:MAG: hypothetical protein HFJ48_05595 [Clostridia bacterium]|nr:hypothetical protein [Clostridia bacterium]
MGKIKSLLTPIQKLEEEQRKESISGVNMFVDYNLRMAMYKAVEFATTENDLYVLATTDYHLNPEIEAQRQDMVNLFQIILNNDKCNKDTLKAILDYPYSDDNSKRIVYEKVIAHKNATDELYQYIIYFSHGFRYFDSICYCIAKYAGRSSTLTAILNCDMANNTSHFFCALSRTIVQNKHVTEEIMLDMLIKCVIHNNIVFYEHEYSRLLSEIVKKTKKQRTLELAISLAMQNNLAYNFAVFETWFKSNKVISSYLFNSCLHDVLKEADSLVQNLDKYQKPSEEITQKLRNSGVTKILYLLVESKFSIEPYTLKKIIDFARAANLPELATIIAKREDCCESHLVMLLYFKEDKNCSLAILSNPNRTEAILSELAVIDCGAIIYNLIADELISSEILDKIARFDSWYYQVYCAILEHPKHSVQTELRLLNNPSLHLADYIAKYTKSVDILTSLSSYDDEDVEVAVYQNPMTPSHIKRSIEAKWNARGNIPTVIFVTELEMSLNSDK